MALSEKEAIKKLQAEAMRCRKRNKVNDRAKRLKALQLAIQLVRDGASYKSARTRSFNKYGLDSY